MDGYTQTLEVYGCADCSGCKHKAQCLYKYNPEKDADKNKIRINYQYGSTNMECQLKKYIFCTIQQKTNKTTTKPTTKPSQKQKHICWFLLT